MNRYAINSDGTLDDYGERWTPAELPHQQTSNEGLTIDGGCIDLEDGTWMAMSDYERFVDVNGHREISHQVKERGQIVGENYVRYAIACALGGPDMRTLYMVTNYVPKGETVFEAMTLQQTKCVVTSIKVEVPGWSVRTQQRRKSTNTRKNPCIQFISVDELSMFEKFPPVSECIAESREDTIRETEAIPS